jgi:hypothetical protein
MPDTLLSLPRRIGDVIHERRTVSASERRPQCDADGASSEMGWCQGGDEAHFINVQRSPLDAIKKDTL